ncbi:spermidine synthase [Microplitis mediator]|uniref:spermidine synthase n=1 Tax=Microplitis mediator TaxID=375433 RepID=UPI0025574539|nr:spermidine synthase [Microplitis mediator]
MDSFKKGWFSEYNDLWPGISVSFEVTKILHHEKSQFQDILLIETKSHGKVLVLDGIIQCSQNDEFSYQEMISFLPLCSHPNPKNVLIVGGGDGGVAREVVKHPDVQHVTQVEIDGRVLDLSRKYLPQMACGLDHPKVTLYVGDGFEFMKNHSQQFDVIITDSSDPVGPAECLFKESYFALMKTALKPGGIVCSQAGTVWSNDRQVEQTLGHCRSVFPVAVYGTTSVPTYPTGQIGFVIGSLNPKTKFQEPIKIFSEKELDDMDIKYYDDKIHRSSFVLPRFAAKALNQSLGK